MRVVPVPQLVDNYAYLVVDEETHDAAVVDCAEAEPVLREASRLGVRLVAVLATHHHYDHVGGNAQLLRAVPGLRIYGSSADAARIPGITDRLRDGDHVRIGSLEGRVILIPAHTSGHVAYHFPREKVVFTGDTLFAAGCGRLFEGDAAEMVASLSRLTALPDETLVYCGHEYTQKNLEFALRLEPSNAALVEKKRRVDALREAGQPTVPTSIGEEKATNPFLRTGSPELERSVRDRVPGIPAGDHIAVFAALRALKDRY